MQANSKIHLWKSKAPIYNLSRNKAPKTQLIEFYNHPKKTSDLLVGKNRDATLAPAKIVAYLDCLAKVFVRVQSSIQ